MVDVGKYVIPYMDPMGIESSCSKCCIMKPVIHPTSHRGTMIASGIYFAHFKSTSLTIRGGLWSGIPTIFWLGKKTVKNQVINEVFQNMSIASIYGMLT